MKQRSFTDDIIEKLNLENITYLLDDREQRPGIKFKDAELIGIPIHIIVGKKFTEGIVEVKLRDKSQKVEINKSELIDLIKGEING